MINIDHNTLTQIKQINLPELVQSKGIVLRHNGNGSYTGLCPFHKDTNPSLNISYKDNKWIWHCFGCGEKGTVIDFVMRKEGLSFQDVYKRLSGLVQDNTLDKEDRENIEDINPEKLLNDIARFYHDTFKEDRRGLEYLVNRRIQNQEIYLDFKIGFVNGSLRKRLPKGGAIIRALKGIGILNERGNEHFYNCVVFPIFDEDGNTVSFYGRSIEEKKHLYLRGEHKGVFNSKVLGTTKRIYLTESIIDSLSLRELGINEVVSLYGTNGLTGEHIRLFEKYMIKEVYLCLDNDDAGECASKKIASKLKEIGISSYRIKLPEGIKDINEYILREGNRGDFDRFIKEAQVLECTQANLISKDIEISEDDTGITFNFKGRRYRIRGLSVGRLDQLKVNIKLTNYSSYHIDTIDLYSAKARGVFIAQVKKVLNIEGGILEGDLLFIVNYLEEIQGRMIAIDTKGEDRQWKMSEEEKKVALEYLRSEDLLEDIIKDFKACGYIGEESNLILGYLVSISRKLSTPLAVLVVSRSAAGKSTLQDAILSFTPQEDYEKYTRLTDQALFYKDENALRNKLLAIEEERGVQGAGYSLRNLQSSQGLRTASTIKDPETGKLRTDVYKVSGPTSIMITTTLQESFDYETYNRFIILTIDESIEQTRLILERQRLEQSIEGIVLRRRREKIKAIHHNAQRLLKVLEVANPYSEQLTFSESLLRARREQPKYLAIIKAIALLRQYQKEIKTYKEGSETIEYIEVDLKDIEIANRICNEILGRSLDEMSPPSRRLLVEIRMLVERVSEDEKIPQDKCIISRRDIREFTRWSDYQVRTHIKELEELEYLIPVNGSKGKRFTYKLMWDGEGEDGTRFLLGLIDVSSLKLQGQKSNYEGR